MILIRETNGNLRTAAPDERDAINFKYFPKPGKLSHPIVAFEDNYLKAIGIAAVARDTEPCS